MRGRLLPTLCAALFITLAQPAMADQTIPCDPHDPLCGTDPSGITISATGMISLPTGHVPGGGATTSYEYGESTMCGGVNRTEPGHDENCGLSRSYCATNPPEAGDGPAVYVFRRTLHPTSDWVALGHTCWPELVPGDKTPTMAMIEAAFHRTPFALPGVHIQPEGNRTLVTLPTYFALEWTEKGFEPEEIDTLNPRDWFGLTVRVKPVFQSVTYSFGDGTGEGPTTKLGGPYPTGDIVHTYDTGGVYDTQVTAVVTGQVSLNGSEWIDIPGQADLAGPVTPLTVLTARNHLYLPGG